MECTLKDIQDLSGAGITAMVIGEVLHVSVEEEYAQGYKMRYGKDGFMMLVPAPQNLITGEPAQSGVAIVDIQKIGLVSFKFQKSGNFHSYGKQELSVLLEITVLPYLI